MKKTRVLALLLVLAAMLTALSSCGLTPTSAIANAEKALTKAPYKIEMEMDLTCADKTYASIIEAMNTEMTMFVDGDNFQMGVSATGVDMTVTYVDGTAYSSMSAFGQIVRQKATLTEEQKAEFLEKNGASVGVDAIDFGSLSMTKDEDGDKIITCTELPEEALNELMESTLGDMGAGEISMTAKDVKMTIELDDGKYDTVTLTLTYVMTVAGETVEIGARIELEYDYGDDAKTVTAPKDADTYETADYEDIFG